MRYRAGAGAPALPVGSEVPLAKAICAASLRTGQVIRSEDVNPEVLFDPEVCRQRGILSLVVVPIYRENEIVGALELYFDRIHGFADQDIHTCQLMAGLVTEAIGRDAESTLKKSMAAERSSMLAAIEKTSTKPGSLGGRSTLLRLRPKSSASAAAAATAACWKCGSKLVTEEQFCGKCGAPRASDARTLQHAEQAGIGVADAADRPGYFRGRCFPARTSPFMRSRVRLRRITQERQPNDVREDEFGRGKRHPVRRTVLSAAMGRRVTRSVSRSTQMHTRCHRERGYDGGT